MPFFLRPQVQHPFQAEEDLFSLLAGLDTSSHPCANKRRPQQKKPEPTFTPRFDVLETPTTYELFGELPGLKQEDLVIEFADVQTLSIKGKTSRPETASADKTVEAAPEQVQTPSEKDHHATVEDDYDVADTPLSSSPASPTTPTHTKKTVEEKAEAQVTKPKYWISERQVGSFERTFSFSQRLEIDDVRAELNSGVLRVVVPKSQKARKVTVSVQ